MPRPRGSTTTPKLTHHKASGRAVVRIDGADHYCGRWGTPEAQQKYDRLIGEWLVRGRQTSVAAPGKHSGGIAVVEVLAAFWTHALTYYGNCVQASGAIAGELDKFRIAMRPLKKLYALTPAAEFGAVALKAVRAEMLKPGVRGKRRSRTTVNRAVGRIKHIFRWASENELVPASVYHSVATVAGLRAGRSDAPEPVPVRPVSDADVDAVLPLVSDQVAAMIRLQLLTGARPGEICALRTGDVDRTRAVWIYKPATHKTKHHGHAREIRIGERAQHVLTPFLKLDPTAYVFSPTEAESERREQQRNERSSPLPPPSHVAPSKSSARRQRSRAPGARYTVTTYRRAIARACDRAFPAPQKLARHRVPARGRKSKSTRWETRTEWRTRLGPEEWAELVAWEKAHRWHPNRLRHSAATRLRRDFGIDAARVILGHRSTTVTEVYAEVDGAKADMIMQQVG